MVRITCALLGLGAVVAAPAAGQEVVISTYIGADQGDVVTGVGVQPDGTLVVGGTNGGQRLLLKTDLHTWVHGGRGYVMRISPGDGKILSSMRFDGSVCDVDVGPGGEIYATGSFGAAKMARGGALLWANKARDDNGRIAPGPAGSAVQLAGAMVSIIGGNGKVIKRFGLRGDHLEDIACDVQTGLIYVTGYDDYRPPGSDEILAIPFVHAYDGRGKIIWIAYDWKGALLQEMGLAIDCRAYRVVMGADGKLYMIGECVPGTTVFTYNSKSLKERVTLVVGDEYQKNDGNGYVTFIARLDPRTGNSETGTFLRACGGQSNECRARGIAADRDGKVYVVGRSACHPPVNDGVFAADVPAGNSGFFQILGPDLKRIYGTRLCAGSANAVAVIKGAIIVGGEASDSLQPVKPIQEKKGGGDTDGWFVAYAVKAASETAP